MKITTIGRGSIGGTLAQLWRAAGHEVTELGHDGGDATGADVVLLAVPSATVAEALAGVTGLAGTTVIDATNRLGGEEPPEGHASVAEYVSSVTGGPVAKAFNLNFGALLERAADGPTRPGNVWVGDEQARDAVEQLTRDVGMEPNHGGPLDLAGTQEAFARLLVGILNDAGGPVFYRFATPDRF